MTRLLALMLLLAPLLVNADIYPKTALAQEAIYVDRGFVKLAEAVSNYAFDNCSFPDVIAQVTPSYAFLPNGNGRGVWTVGRLLDDSQGFVCYHGIREGDSARARLSVKNKHAGLVSANGCGTSAIDQVLTGDEYLTWWVPTMVFPDDCITGP